MTQIGHKRGQREEEKQEFWSLNETANIPLPRSPRHKQSTLCTFSVILPFRAPAEFVLDHTAKALNKAHAIFPAH